MSKPVLERKQAQVSQIKDTLDQSTGVVFADYRGLTVEEMTDLRRDLRKNGAACKVYKNTLTRMALNDLNLSYPHEMVAGPSVMISAETDIVGASKVLVELAEDNESLSIKGGFLDNKVIDESVIRELAKLPSKEELIAKVVGGIAAPLTSFVSVMPGPARSLVNALQAIQDQKDA